MTDKDTYMDDESAPLEDELEEVWSLFGEDGREALDLVEETLLDLESDPTDARQVARLFRGLHTFKGNARMMGLDVVESLAHHAEDLVALVRDGGVALTSAMVDLLLEVLDHLRETLDHALAHRRDADAAQVAGVTARLKDVLAEYEHALPSWTVVHEEVGEGVGDLDDLFDFTMLEELELAPEPALGESAQDILVEEVIDPATDPEYVRIFLEMAGEGMERLQAALDALAARAAKRKQEGVQQVKAVADTLIRAAERMGYEHLVAILGDLVPAAGNLSGKARVARLKELVLALSEGIAAIQSVDMVQPPDVEKIAPAPARRSHPDWTQHLQAAIDDALTMEPFTADADVAVEGIFSSPSQSTQQPPQPSPASPTLAENRTTPAVAPAPDTTRLFEHWCAMQACAYLSRLGEIASNLEQFLKQFLAGSSALTWDEELADEAAYLLRAVYPACVFHGFDQAGRLTLALEDLYARVAQEEMTVSDALIALTRVYVARLGSTFEAIRDGRAPEFVSFADLLDRTEEILYLYTESQMSRVTRAVLDMLDLPPEFQGVVTPENLLEVGRALRAGEDFYVVLADLNEDGETSQAFYEWSRSGAARLITNVTVFQDNHTLFNFLLATTAPQDVMEETFVRMDPQGHYLSLKKCTWREGVDLAQAMSEQAVQPIPHRARCVEKPQGTISMEALASFVEAVGELVASRATLHRVTERLRDMNLVDAVNRLVKQSDGDWQRVRNELQTSLESWNDDLRTLSHAETEMGAALDQFQETALALRARPAAEILDPLQRLVQDMGQYLGKSVELTVTGANIGLDHSALDVLATPVRHLVWFAVAHGIEKPIQRQEAGKPATGHISVTVGKTADHVQVVIEDDGNGLDPDAVLKRVRELGWTKGKHIPAGKLSAWVLRDGFGMVGGSYDVEGLDLAAIHAELQARRGWLDVTSEPGQGTRFWLDIPLDMVVIDGMVMRVGEVFYVAPIEVIRRIVKPEATQIVRSSADGGQHMVRLGDDLVPIQTLQRGSGSVLMNNGRGSLSPDSLLLIVEQNGQGIALVVDELLGQQQVLIQPLQGHLADVPHVSGCALLGEDDVGMVLDINQISRQAGKVVSRASHA
jgi:two-component system chemotaxis sensor kinase CheA